MSQIPDQTGESGRKDKRGIGFGVFLLLAGVVLLAEKVGLLPSGSDWFLPAVLIAWGASEVYQRLSRS